MSGLTLRMLSCAMLALCADPCSGYAAGGHPDYGSQDLYAACNSPRTNRRSNILQDRQNSVFALLVNRRAGWERTGTATLIDDTGIFIAAGHSVYFDKSRPIKIVQKLGGIVREFGVRLLSNPDNFENDDYVLLQALNWTNESRFPYPLRFDDVGLSDADFIGFEEATDEPIHRNIPYFSENASGRHYQGMIFADSSGALLYDQRGRGFGLVIMHTPWTISSFAGLPPERLAEEWNKRATISIFPLERALETLKQNVPMSAFMSALIQDLQANIAPSRLPGDLDKKATPLDMIFLIDESVFGKVYQKWVSEVHAMSRLSKTIQAAADELRVSSYYHDAFAKRMLQDLLLQKSAIRTFDLPTSPLPASEEKPEFKGSQDAINAGQKNQERAATESIMDQLGADSPDAAAKLGLRFLENALSAPPTQYQLTQSRLILSIALFRRALGSPVIQRAREEGTKDRDFAAVFANLAVAEDLGISYNVGTRTAAEAAIRAADRLGGSPTAYQLAAHYARQEGDPIAAAGLYAQAFAMLEPDRKHERYRDEVSKDFSAAIAEAGFAPNIEISEFDIASLPNRGASSSWYGFAITANVGRLVSLAQLYERQGREAEAEPLYNRALDIYQKAFGPEHPEVAKQLGNLASVYVAQANFSEAERLFKRVLALDEKVLGPDNVEVANELNNLADVYRAQDRFAEAAQLSGRALTIFTVNEKQQHQPSSPEDATVFIEAHIKTIASDGHVKLNKVGEGSGFLIDASGWILTTALLLKVETPPGTELVFTGSVKSRFNEKFSLQVPPQLMVWTDVALLRFPDGHFDLKHLCLADRPVAVGEDLVALGFPLGSDLSTRLGKVASFGPLGSIQTNLGFARGMSGGPVLNNNGLVVGVIRSDDSFTPTNLLSSLVRIFPRINCSGSGTAAASDSLWDHNGSVLRLISGPQPRHQRFAFVELRSALANIGVAPGMVQFDGVRDGDSYSGSGYAFSRSCGAVRFEMTGRNIDERSIRLRGRQPRVDPRTCAKVSPIDVEWAFEKK
jgi:S1-C subfamily serine protease